jgi:hypothetical protein
MRTALPFDSLTYQGTKVPRGRSDGAPLRLRQPVAALVASA